MTIRNSLRKMFSRNARKQVIVCHLSFGQIVPGVLRFAISCILCAIIFTTAAAAQLSAGPPSPNTQSVYAGDNVSFAVNVSGQQGSLTYFWQFSVNGAPYTTLNDGPQASGSTISGAATATLLITNTQAGDTGRYRCLVSDSTGQINSGPGSLTVTVPPPPTATQPTDVTATRGNTATFMVNASGYGRLVYQWQVSSPAGVTFVNVSEGGRNSGSTTATLQIASVQPSDAGWYRCLVSNAGGPVNSGRATLTVLASPPANLAASTFSSTAINLSWTNTDPDAKYVVIERAPCTTGAFCTAVQATAQFTAFQDGSSSPGSGLSPSTTYTYRAYAMYITDSLAGSHIYSNQTSATTMAATLPPTGFLATPVSSTQINLSWTNQDPTATSVVIERQALTTGTGTPFFQLTSLGPPPPTAYLDDNNGTGLPSQTAFNYRAYAVSPRGVSVYTNTSQTTTLAPPPVPLSFQATMISSGEIDLSWNNSDPTVTGYLIERQSGGGSYSQLPVVSPASNHSDKDLGVLPATQYMYRMRAQSPTGISAYTDPVSATTSPAPPTPTQIYATPVSPTQIDVSWRNPPGNFTIHIEQKKAQHPPFMEIGTVGTSEPPVFHATGLDPATTYFYQVRAADAAGNFSPYSTLAINSTLVPAPTNLSSTRVNAGLIDLKWTNAFSGYTKLHLYENGPNDLVRFKVADIDGNATSYEFTGVLPNTSYSFALQAEVSGVSDLFSDFSNDLVVTTTQKVTIFFVHGTGQKGGGLDGLAAALRSVIDPGGVLYNFDSGFDWSRCAITGGQHQRFPFTPLPAGEDQGALPIFPLIPGFPPNPCPNNCTVTDGAEDLAGYIARQKPPGDVFIIAYSLGGNVARDMIEGQPGSGIDGNAHKLLGLVTLATGNNGYPYEYPWDNLALCDGLAKEIASDIRGNPASYPFNGQYIQHINANWLNGLLGGAGYKPFPWLAAAGAFCKSPIRFPDSTQNGCPAGSSNDGVVCADSALLAGLTAPTYGNFNRPTSTFVGADYSHSSERNHIAQFLVYDRNSNGDASAFYNGHCNMPDHISMWDPGAGSSLVQQIANFIQANAP
jgi:hypothetical protein